MKSAGILYAGDRKISSERFLSKNELRKLFPEHSIVAITISVRRRRFNKKGTEEAKTGKNKRKKKGFNQKADKFVRHGRVINLF